MAWVETRTMTKRLRFVQVKCYMEPFVYTIVPCWPINSTAMVLSPSMEAFLLLSLQQAPTSSIAIIFVTQNLVCQHNKYIIKYIYYYNTLRFCPLSILSFSSDSILLAVETTQKAFKQNWIPWLSIGRHLLPFFPSLRKSFTPSVSVFMYLN